MTHAFQIKRSNVTPEYCQTPYAIQSDVEITCKIFAFIFRCELAGFDSFADCGPGLINIPFYAISDHLPDPRLITTLRMIFLLLGS